MKNIELTENQKVKLLEMCRILFPEYPDLQFGVKEKHNWSKEYLVFGLTGNEPIIHWFEFCITKIVNELSWKNIKTDILADCEYEDFRMKLITEIFRDKFTTETFHIVDYLYEEFKKLK